MPERKIFYVYRTNAEYFDALKDRELGMIFRAMYQYAFYQKEPDWLNDKLVTGFILIRPHLDADREKYKRVCERNRKNGQKGGRPKKTPEPEQPDSEA